MERFRLTPEELFWRCDPAQFEFDSTRDLPPLEETIGQDRAFTAIEFGLGMDNSGFNIFILGEPGTGRSSTIKKVLARRSVNEATCSGQSCSRTPRMAGTSRRGTSSS